MTQSATAFRIGTRGSDLALAQATMTEAALRAADPSIVLERIIVKTSGDLRPDLRLSEFSQGDEPVVDKGIFTKELEMALRAGEIDIAVHSLKDVPTELAPEFEIAGVLPRAPIEDVLISKHPGGLAGLPTRARVATSSVRRRRILLWRRPDLNIEEIRGNVPTRIQKLRDGEGLDAIVLAQAGLGRLGIEFEAPLHATTLESAEFPPAAGQGAVGIELRTDDDIARDRVASINHGETFTRVRAEREFLRLLQAGCQTPVGAITEIKNGRLHMAATVFDEDDLAAPPKQASTDGPVDDPIGTAATLIHQLSHV